MDRIYVGFGHHKGKFAILSWLIRLFHWSKYSHAYIYFFDKYHGRWLYYDATSHGVRFRNKEEFGATYAEVVQYSFLVDKPAKKDIVTFCIDNLGTKYSTLQILTLWLKIISFGLIKIRLKDDRVICNELVGLIIERLGFEIPQDLSIMDLNDLNEHLGIISATTDQG